MKERISLLLKYSILGLLILSLPQVILNTFGSTLGSLFSYLTFILLVLYYALVDKGKLNIMMLAFAFSYYIISSFQSIFPFKEFVMNSAKFFIIIICGNELLRKVSVKEFFVFFLLGAISIIGHALLFPGGYGRYSGFYYNPNNAGFVAITAFILSFNIKNKYLKIVGILFATLAGFLTLSRTFIALWLLSNVLALRGNIKNLKIFVLGILVIIGIFTFGSVLQINTTRFEMYKGLLNNDSVATASLQKGGRTETWSKYYDIISENLFFGNGFGTLRGSGKRQGVHNSFLLILGEAGIIPFLFFMGFVLYLLYWDIKLFKKAPYLLTLNIAVIGAMMAAHGLMYNYYFCILLLWIYHQIEKNKADLQKELALINQE